MFRGAISDDKFLTGIVDSAAGNRQSLFEQSKREAASEFTPVTRKCDLNRTSSIAALHSYLDSKINRKQSIPEQAKIAETLSALLSLKCPDIVEPETVTSKS